MLMRGRAYHMVPGRAPACLRCNADLTKVAKITCMYALTGKLGAPSGDVELGGCQRNAAR